MRTLPITLTCLLIATAVLMSGAHAKELVALSLPLTEKTNAAEQMVKVAPDLHHHGDATAKIQSGDGHQADTRSLRLLHEHKKSRAFHAKLGDRLRAWWQLSSLVVG